MQQGRIAALVWVPGGGWQSREGSEFDIRLQVPLLKPTLRAVGVERQPGLVVWAFDGFFRGRDRWEAQPEVGGNTPCTTLLNRFEFTIPNPLVSFGFQQFAAGWTKRDMQAQLQRLKQVAERL